MCYGLKQATKRRLKQELNIVLRHARRSQANQWGLRRVLHTGCVLIGAASQTRTRRPLTRVSASDGSGVTSRQDARATRSERFALTTNAAAQQQLASELRGLDSQRRAAASRHDMQRHRFLHSVSGVMDDDDVTTETQRHKTLSRSQEDLKDPDSSGSDRNKARRSKSFQTKKSVSRQNSTVNSGFHDDHVKRPGSGSIRGAQSPVLNRQVSRIRPKLESALSFDDDPSPRQRGSPGTYRRQNSSRLRVSALTRASSFNDAASRASSFVSSGDPRPRTSSFTSAEDVPSLPTPGRVRARVERDIRSSLEMARREAARRKRERVGGSGGGGHDGRARQASWEEQLAARGPPNHGGAEGRGGGGGRTEVPRGSGLPRRGERALSSGSDSDADTEDEDEPPTPTSPYSISSAMRVSSSSGGAFEKRTGKQGLSAWMGKANAKKTHRK